MSCYSRTAYLDTAHLCVVSVCVCVCVLCLLRRLNLIEDATVQQDTGLEVLSNFFFFCLCGP